MIPVRSVLAAASVFVLFLLVPLGNAHVWNFENKGELCGVAPGEYAPHGHSVDDGHAHWHHTSAAASAHEHWNPGTQVFDVMPAGHTHSTVVHDPCLQTRMDYPTYLATAGVPLAETTAPSQAIDPLYTLYPADDSGHSRIYAGGEAYEFPIPLSAWKRQSNLVVASDLQAAGMGFPGTGTREDPYVIEGYIITGNLIVKNTSKCFVVKNNVVVNRTLLGPLIPDLPDVDDLLAFAREWTKETVEEGVDMSSGTVEENVAALRAIVEDNVLIAYGPTIPAWEDVKGDVADRLGQADNELATQQTAQANRDEELAGWNRDLATWQGRSAAWDARAAEWWAAWDQYARDYYAVVVATEDLTQRFQEYASQYTAVTAPAKPHATYVDYTNGKVTDLGAIDTAFEGYQQSGTSNVAAWIEANTPPQDPPAGWSGTAAEWDAFLEGYEAFEAYVDGLVDAYWEDLQASAPDEELYEEFLEGKADFADDHAAFLAEHEAYVQSYNEARAAYDAFLAEYEGLYDWAAGIVAEADAAIAKANAFGYKYEGVKGTKLFNDLGTLLNWIVGRLTNIVNALDPNNVARNTGQLTLDWNGQCMHAYNNVAYDLRVNQNNDRKGYATGGIIEQNRFYTIGQIRHYDGIFRDNEVGNRAFLHSLVNPSVVPLASSARAINNDGANQGWYYDNVIYGQVDLDFHGHHHSAGFFSPQSHYHGSDPTHAYMKNAAGACTATSASVNQAAATGPEDDYPSDNDIHAFHNVVLAQADPAGCLPHFDHGKRWTSVFFNDNLVIDPNGVGLRFEDRDHRGDDEQANSENLRELKKPHYHQKWVQLEGNTIVGKLFVDVLNAAGTELWSDNWAAVLSPKGAPRTQEALAHPGAEIVNSHPYRNDAWLDIRDNTILQTQAVGILVSDAADMTRFQLKDNRGIAFPKNYQTTQTPLEFLAWLKGLPDATVDEIDDDVEELGGVDRGVQTFAYLAFLRNAFTVEHCGNAARGLDRGFVAKDRIYDDGLSIIQACGSSDYLGANPQVDIVYTPAPAKPVQCTESMRDFTDGTDDFYVTEFAFDTVDGAKPPATVCDELDAPIAPPTPDKVADPVKYAQDSAAAAATYAKDKLGL